MKITGIKIKDYLILKDVEIKPESKLNIFCGKNRAGKSSIMKAIHACFKGTTDATVIRNGAKKSEIQIDVEGLKIKRTIRKSGQLVKVTTDNGDMKLSPQTFIDSLVGNFTFDPIAFILMTPKERKKHLLDLFNVHVTPGDLKDVASDDILQRIDFTKDGFSVINDIENIYYGQRTTLNRQCNQKEAAIQEKLNKLGDFDIELFDKARFDKVKDELHNAEVTLANAELMKAQEKDAKATIDKLTPKVDAIKKQILPVKHEDNLKELKARQEEHDILMIRFKDIQRAINQTIQQINDLKKQISQHNQLKDELTRHQETITMLNIYKDIPDIEKLQEDVANKKVLVKAAEEDVKKFSLHSELQQNDTIEFQEIKKATEDLTLKIRFLREDFTRSLYQKSHVPIPDIRFDNDTIMIGEKNLDHMSTAEKVSVALTIAREINKHSQMKFLCLDNVEALDDETLEAFKEQIKDDEFTYYIALVQHSDVIPEGAFRVHDGDVTKVKGGEQYVQ